MLTKERIYEIYDRVLEENEAEIKREKKEAIKEKIFNLIMMVVTIIIEYKIISLIFTTSVLQEVVSKIFSMKPLSAFTIVFLSWPLIALLICTPVLFWFYRKKKFYTYINNFKDRMLKEIIKEYNESFEYLPMLVTSMKEYEKSMKFTQCKIKEYEKNAEFLKFNNYKITDLIKGYSNNNYDFELVQIIGYSGDIPVGGGLYAKMEIKKDFDMTVYLRKKLSTGVDLNRKYRCRLKNEKNKLEFNIEEFNKKFEIYSSNKEKAIELLNEEIINMLKDLEECEITIKNNNIYINLNTGGIIFNNTLLKKDPISKNALCIYYKSLGFILDLTNKLVDAANNI